MKIHITNYKRFWNNTSYYKPSKEVIEKEILISFSNEAIDHNVIWNDSISFNITLKEPATLLKTTDNKYYYLELQKKGINKYWYQAIYDTWLNMITNDILLDRVNISMTQNLQLINEHNLLYNEQLPTSEFIYKTDNGNEIEDTKLILLNVNIKQPRLGISFYSTGYWYADYYIDEYVLSVPINLKLGYKDNKYAYTTQYTNLIYQLPSNYDKIDFPSSISLAGLINDNYELGNIFDNFSNSTYSNYKSTLVESIWIKEAYFLKNPIVGAETGDIVIYDSTNILSHYHANIVNWQKYTKHPFIFKIEDKWIYCKGEVNDVKKTPIYTSPKGPVGSGRKGKVTGYTFNSVSFTGDISSKYKLIPDINIKVSRLIGSGNQSGYASGWNWEYDINKNYLAFYSDKTLISKTENKISTYYFNTDNKNEIKFISGDTLLLNKATDKITITTKPQKNIDILVVNQYQQEILKQTNEFLVESEKILTAKKELQQIENKKASVSIQQQANKIAFEKEQNKRNYAINILNGIFGITGGGLSAVSGMATMNPGMIASGVSQVASSVGGLINANANYQFQEQNNNFERQKLLIDIDKWKLQTTISTIIEPYAILNLHTQYKPYAIVEYKTTDYDLRIMNLEYIPTTINLFRENVMLNDIIPISNQLSNIKFKSLSNITIEEWELIKNTLNIIYMIKEK